MLFIDLTDHCEGCRRRSFFSQKDIETLVNLCRQRKAASPSTHLTTLDEIQENEYNLSIQRYIKKPEDSQVFEPVALRQQYQSILADLTDTGKRIQERLDDLGFVHNN